jgi:hypothetical protein
MLENYVIHELNLMSHLFEFIRVEGGVTFSNILRGGASYKSLETSVIEQGC